MRIGRDEATEQSESRGLAGRVAALVRSVSPWGIVVFVIGMLVRVWVMKTRLGGVNSDEAYTSLQAAEILKGHWPIVIPGLVYTAPFDSYLLAPLVAVFGQRPLLLKLFPSIAWGCSALLLGSSVRRLVGRREGFVAASIYWIAPGALALLAVRSWQNYASAPMFVSASLFAVVRLFETANGQPSTVSPRRSAIVGALAGMAFYLHPMFIAALVPLLLVPCWVFRRQLRSWWVPMIAAGLVVNGPFLMWNAKNGWPSLAQPAASTEGPAPRLVRFFTGLIPRAYGLRSPNGAWMFGQAGSIVLLLLLLALAAFGVVALVRIDRTKALLVALPLTLSWLLMSMFANMTFVTDGRYAVVTLPFVMAAVAIGASRLFERVRLPAGAFVVVWLGLLVVPFVNRESGRTFVDPNVGARQIAAVLESRGVTRVAGYYWLVLPIELVTDGAIRTSVTGNPYTVLLPWTQRLVESTPPEELAFVWPNRNKDEFLLSMPIERYEMVDVAGAVLYVPRPTA
jgi:hypothetical protein